VDARGLLIREKNSVVFSKLTCAEKVDFHAFSGTHLPQVSIWHDGKGVDAHWFLEDVTIIDSSNRRSVTNRYEERVLYWQPTGANPLYHRDN